MAELRVAVIGCGGIGGTHLMRWAEVSGVQLVAVCDIDSAAAMRAAAEFGADAHTDWFSLIQGGGLDLLDICTPPDQHAVIARHALARGLHVLCEKPLARTPEEARAMVTQAEQSDRLLMPAFCHRFHPPVLFARELIENDDLGRIIMFRNRFSGLFAGIEDRWFAHPEVAGGGSLIDTAVHSIDLFRYLVGEVATASGKIAAFNPKLRVEDSAVVTLQAENGALGVIESSWATPGGRNTVELYGTAGTCIIDYDSGHVQYKTADMAVWETREVGGPDRFQREILHFCDAARGLQSPLVTALDGLRANEIIAEIYATQPLRQPSR